MSGLVCEWFVGCDRVADGATPHPIVGLVPTCPQCREKLGLDTVGLLFPPGRLAATPGAVALLESASTHPLSIIMRHLTGDWGDLDDHDKAMNTASVMSGNRVVSAYTLGQDPASGKVWVITEADRSVTTVLLPEEY